MKREHPIRSKFILILLSATFTLPSSAADDAPASLTPAAPLSFTSYYPWPTGPNAPLATYNGLYLYPYSSPFVDHVGRFLDSAFTVDILSPHPRTLRAKEVALVPERNKVYMQMGEHFVAYRYDDFFTSQLGNSLSNALTAAHTTYPEGYLQWYDDVYPESAGSGWVTYVMDGQRRLFDFDWDDRGYAYVAYFIWGFGIVHDLTLTTTRQVSDAETGSNPTVIRSFRNGSSYYVLVGGANTEVWNVTQPAFPVLVRTISGNLVDAAVADAGEIDYVALALSEYDSSLGRSVASLKIYSASALVLGQQPQTKVTPAAGNNFFSVTTDETNFFALEKPSNSRSFILHTLELDAGAYADTARPYSGMAPAGIRYGASHLTIWGNDDSRANDIWLFQLSGLTPIRRDLGSFIRNYYTALIPPAGYTNPAQAGYTGEIYDALYAQSGGKDYLIVSAKGLGDVYEMEPAPCVAAPGAIAARARGLLSGCLDDMCVSANETLEFRPEGLGYLFQSCDGYSWDFGDGGTSTDEVAYHRFPGAGSYPVTLTVTNQIGNAQAELMIVIGNDSGDPNGDAVIGISDIFSLIDHLHGSGASVAGSGDPNGDTFVNDSDITYLVEYHFAAGPAPK